MTIKKIKLSVLLLTLLGSTAFSKEDCKHVETYDDGFGSVKQGIIFSRVYSFEPLSLIKEDGKVILKEAFFTQGDYNIALKQDSKLLVSLENGNILTLKIEKEILPIRKASSQLWTSWTVSQTLSNLEIKELSTSPVKAMKIKIGDKDIIQNYNKRDSKKLMKVAKCFFTQID